MATQRAVVGAATNSDGTVAVQTSKQFNTLIADTKLRFKLSAASDSTATNIVLKSGAARNGTNLGLNNKLTYSANTDGFASYADMVNYHKFISTNIIGLVIQTTDTDNYEDNTLIISEQDPSGRVVSITKDLSDYRVTNGQTISDKIVLEASDLNQTTWAGWEMAIANIKPSSSMTFTFLLQGVNKVQELNAIRAVTLG